MARFDLPDVEWLVISALLPNKPRGVARVDDRRVLNADGRALGRHSGALWSAHDLREPFQQVTQGGRLGSAFGSCVKAYDGDIQMIEWSSIRLHQHAANAKKRRSIRLHELLAGRTLSARFSIAGMGLLGRRWRARAPNQFVTDPFVPRRCAKKEGIFDLAALAPAIHTAKKILGKMAGQGAHLGR